MSEKENLTKNNERTRKLVAAGGIALFLIIAGTITYFAGAKIGELAKDPAAFRDWISSFTWLAPFIFIGLAAIQVIFAVIPGGPVQIAAGYAFGIVEGSLWCIVGIQLGSAVAFLLARYLGMRAVEIFFPKEKIESIRFLQDSKRLDFIVFVCFLIPGAPKDLLTYVCGMTKISFWRFMLLTTMARLPSIVLSVMSGNALIFKEYKNAVIIFSVILICSTVGVFLYRYFVNREATKKEAPKSEGAGADEFPKAENPSSNENKNGNENGNEK